MAGSATPRSKSWGGGKHSVVMVMLEDAASNYVCIDHTVIMIFIVFLSKISFCRPFLTKLNR